MAGVVCAKAAELCFVRSFVSLIERAFVKNQRWSYAEGDGES